MDEVKAVATKQCPYCAEDIKVEAKICKHCRMDVTPEKKPRELSPKESAAMQDELAKSSKSALVAYLLWFFLGGVGAHQFYAGSIIGGVFYLLIFFGGIATGGLTLPAFLVAWFIDALILEGQIKRRNKREAEKILAKYQ